MRNRTIVTILAVFGLLVVIVAVQPVFACTEGCTPGYWKQPHHFDSWPTGITPGTNFMSLTCWDEKANVVRDFGCPDMTLEQMLRAKGGGANAFYRHAAAGVLNLLAGLDYKDCDFVADQVARGCSGDYEGAKDLFEEFNEYFCPLD